MTWLFAGSEIIFPDGKKRPRPKDGERFFHNNENYTWDDAIEKWANWHGRIVDFEEKIDNTSSNSSQKEGDKLRDFFFPKNTLGCECGVWLTDSNKHSPHCRLYRRDE